MAKVASNCMKLQKSEKLHEIAQPNLTQFYPISCNFTQFCPTFSPCKNCIIHYNRPTPPLQGKRHKISPSRNFMQFHAIFINFIQFSSTFINFSHFFHVFFIKLRLIFLPTLQNCRKLHEIAWNCMKLRKLRQIAINWRRKVA